jgi:hypothetical protein
MGRAAVLEGQAEGEAMSDKPIIIDWHHYDRMARNYRRFAIGVCLLTLAMLIAVPAAILWMSVTL